MFVLRELIVWENTLYQETIGPNRALLQTETPDSRTTSYVSACLMVEVDIIPLTNSISHHIIAQISLEALYKKAVHSAEHDTRN